VDVLVTIKDPEKEQEVSKTVLENILVLASGTEVQEDGKAGESPVDVYTLEVTPDQAERLVLAAAKGKLQFALRNVTDSNEVKTRGVTIPQLLASMAAPVPPPTVTAAPVKKAPPRPTVRNRVFLTENIRGVELTKQEFTLRDNQQIREKD
jgi:pilus assembly protein CpaB